MAFFGLFYMRKLGVFLPSNTRLSGLRFIRVGSKFGAGSGFWIEAISSYASKNYSPSIEIGDNVSFSDYCHVSCINKVSIGNDVLIGSKVHITDLSHGDYSSVDECSHPDEIPINRLLHSKGPVNIGNNVWIGDGVVILPGVNIGSGCIIGANSVVSRSIPCNAIAAGNPIKIIKIYKEGVWKSV
jgi:lipopolysaccharide O-acetyltransferase